MLTDAFFLPPMLRSGYIRCVLRIRLVPNGTYKDEYKAYSHDDPCGNEFRHMRSGSLVEPPCIDLRYMCKCVYIFVCICAGLSSLT